MTKAFCNSIASVNEFCRLKRNVVKIGRRSKIVIDFLKYLTRMNLVAGYFVHDHENGFGGKVAGRRRSDVLTNWFLGSCRVKGDRFQNREALADTGEKITVHLKPGLVSRIKIFSKPGKLWWMTYRQVLSMATKKLSNSGSCVFAFSSSRGAKSGIVSLEELVAAKRGGLLVARIDIHVSRDEFSYKKK
jgi:hypothetical protein